MALTIKLPRADTLETYVLSCTPLAAPSSPPVFNRIAYAAAHVVSDPRQDFNPWGNAAIDWDTTIAYRHHLWAHGFKIAEAMDTSQRGMGLNWQGAQELIRRSLEASRTVPGADLACGVGTDQLTPADARTLDDVIAAYRVQADYVEKHGGRMILMASRALAKIAKSPDDYRKVYSTLIRQAKDKVVLHWLGDMFDPQLKGYWGSDNFNEALDTVLSIIGDNVDKVEGIKISLLDAQKEIDMRNRLPEGVLCFTGDDFNYAELIEGDGKHFSHALLGIFDAIAGPASAALAALNQGDLARYNTIFAPTVPLSRKIFEAPTQYYKAGVVFLAWLNGHQTHFLMPAGLQSSRGILHYADIFRLADQANALSNPELATERMNNLLRVTGL